MEARRRSAFYLSYRENLRRHTHLCVVASERHRHRYEFNNNYREALAKHGMEFTGFSADGDLVEIVEIPAHPWFVACQFHPEFTSRPREGHPLFTGFIGAAREHSEQHDQQSAA